MQKCCRCSQGSDTYWPVHLRCNSVSQPAPYPRRQNNQQSHCSNLHCNDLRWATWPAAMQCNALQSPELSNLASSNEDQGKPPQPCPLQAVVIKVHKEGHNVDNPADTRHAKPCMPIVRCHVGRCKQRQMSPARFARFASGCGSCSMCKAVHAVIIHA